MIPHIITILIATASVTSYRSVPSQTDASPFVTSIGQRTHPHGCAVSQDLLKKNGGVLDYGDLLYIQDVGFRFVNDCMHQRIKNHIDVWVETKEQEKTFHKKFKGRKLQIWLVQKMNR